MTLVVGLAVFIFWVVCLVRQTPEEYEEIRKSVELEEHNETETNRESIAVH